MNTSVAEDVPKLKEVVALNAQKAEVLLEKVTEQSRTIVALQSEVSELRMIMKKLQEKLEDKDANAKGDPGRLSVEHVLANIVQLMSGPVIGNTDKFMPTLSAEIFGENDFPSPNDCINNERAAEEGGKEGERTNKPSPPVEKQSPLLEDMSPPIMEVDFVPALEEGKDELLVRGV